MPCWRSPTLHSPVHHAQRQIVTSARSLAEFKRHLNDDPERLERDPVFDLVSGLLPYIRPSQSRGVRLARMAQFTIGSSVICMGDGRAFQRR